MSQNTHLLSCPFNCLQDGRQVAFKDVRIQAYAGKMEICLQFLGWCGQKSLINSSKWWFGTLQVAQVKNPILKRVPSCTPKEMHCSTQHSAFKHYSRKSFFFHFICCLSCKNHVLLKISPGLRDHSFQPKKETQQSTV